MRSGSEDRLQQSIRCRSSDCCDVGLAAADCKARSPGSCVGGVGGLECGPLAEDG
jgi:hypothetical protein